MAKTPDPSRSAGPGNPPPAEAAAPAIEDHSEKLRQGGHVVICNWNRKGQAIISELHSDVITDQRLVVIVTDKQLPKRIGMAWRGVFTVDGNPLENLDLVADAEKNFVMIMKDGAIYKNTIQ